MASAWEEFDEQEQNYQDGYASDSDLDEVYISYVDIVTGKVIEVIVDPSFFVTHPSAQQASMESTNSVESETYDTMIPPMNQLIGATPEYITTLRSETPKAKELIPEHSEREVIQPKYLYWDYPRVVPNFQMFEEKMVTIFGNDPDEIKKLICQEGQGEKLKRGDSVRINFYVYLEGTTHCVESNKNLNKPYDITIGLDKNHIPLIRLALLTMKPKEVAAFLETDKYGYGVAKDGVYLGKTRTLCIIEVLMRLHGPSESTSIINMVSAEIKLLPMEEVVGFVENRIAAAMKSLKKGERVRATRMYLEASKCLQDATPRDAHEKNEKIKLLHYLNTKICYVNIGTRQHKIVAQFAKKSIELPIPEREKATAYLYCAKSLCHLNELEEAKMYLDRAQGFPKNEKEVTELRNTFFKKEAENKETKTGSPSKPNFFNSLLSILPH